MFFISMYAFKINIIIDDMFLLRWNLLYVHLFPQFAAINLFYCLIDSFVSNMFLSKSSATTTHPHTHTPLYICKLLLLRRRRFVRCIIGTIRWKICYYCDASTNKRAASKAINKVSIYSASSDYSSSPAVFMVGGRR